MCQKRSAMQLVAKESVSSAMFRVLSYENPEVEARYQDKLGLSSSEAAALFLDVKKFLFLCGNVEVNFALAPTKSIDAGWHEFLLYTQDYADFCETYFGRFIHHQPRSYFSANDTRGSSRAATHELANVWFGKLSSNWGSDADDAAKCEKGCSSHGGCKSK